VIARTGVAVGVPVMSNESLVEELVQQALDNSLTAEDVCAEHPEHIGEVLEQLRRCKDVEAQLEAIFPSPNDISPSESRLRQLAAQLPSPPGYEVESILGRGGMGVVYKAKQLKLNRPVALKMLLAGRFAARPEIVRFKREAEAVAALRHPNVVQIYDVGECEGNPYFTMEFMEGGSLAAKLAGVPQPGAQAAALMVPLARAVQVAHESGIVHRDLKPANIFLTADGTPKIGDFGLARQFEGESLLTLSGSRVGTPSYMAPEQAIGKAGAVGPAADVYSLGAILYEMLTGRPPFRGETPSDTERQVISESPVPPSRLNGRVTRDLETICLKCLRKEPNRRYPSALDLYEDLRRFLEGKPIRARPVRSVERAVKWAQRRPATALLVAALLVMAAAAVGTGLWVHRQEANRRAAKQQRQEEARTAIVTALGRADDLRQIERWQEALHVLADATPNLLEAHSPTLEERLAKAQSDLRIAEDFDRVRGTRTFKPGGAVDYEQRATLWQEAFDRAGLRFGDDPEPLAAYIRASQIRDQLLAALDDRAQVAFSMGDGSLAERLLRINRLADPEPRWGNRFRDVDVWRSREQLEQLADDVINSSQSPPGYQLALLGLLLRQAQSLRGTQLLAAACRRQPSNFWVNREMAQALTEDMSYSESAAYHRIALALRPEDEMVHAGLGSALFFSYQTEEAIAVFRRGLEYAPDSRVLHIRIHFALSVVGYWKEATAETLRALQIAPDDPSPPQFLGEALRDHGRYEEAAVMFRKAIECKPDVVPAHYSLGLLYQQMGRHEDAVNVFRRITELDPAYPAGHEGLGVELAATGHPEEAITEFQAAIALHPRPAGLYAKLGQILRAQLRPEEAAEAFRQATTEDPTQGWSGLAAARLDQGRFADAHAATESLLTPDPDNPFQRELRRRLKLCDLLHAIEAKLPAILAGKQRPADVDTQLALAEWCLRHKRLTSMAADYYASALAAEPTCADDREAGHRLHAVCAAALAGCGIGADALELDDRKRAELRQQALDWLTAEFDVWADRHRVGKLQERSVAAQAMRSWQGNEDLAGVRDEQALARLTSGERRNWETLWSKAATLAARDPVELVRRAREHVGQREWGQAVACYSGALELAPTDDGELWFEYAASQLLAKDRMGYRRACAHMLARCQESKMRSYLVARACTLAEGSADDPELPARLSQGELFGNRKEFWSLTEQAALHVRAGRAARGVDVAEVSLRVDDRPARAVLNWLWLALACHKMGKEAEARRWLDRAANWLDQQGEMPHQTSMLSTIMAGHRHNWLEAHALFQEAKTLLQ